MISMILNPVSLHRQLIMALEDSVAYRLKLVLKLGRADVTYYNINKIDKNMSSIVS